MTPRASQLGHTVAMQLALTEYARCLDLLRSLSPQSWTASTECPAWDVRQMACHMLGMMEMAASVPEAIRQQRKAARVGSDPLDALTQLQVDERADWTPAMIIDRWAARAPKAARARRRTPALLRRLPLSQPQRVNGATEGWTIGFLLDVIMTRDPWMHRLDIAAATGADPVLSPDHDGVLIADVVAEWADRHGKDFTLTLTGSAGGHWSVGDNGPTLQLDAIDFCRILAGRPGSVSIHDLMSTEVPF